MVDALWVSRDTGGYEGMIQSHSQGEKGAVTGRLQLTDKAMISMINLKQGQGRVAGGLSQDTLVARPHES